MNPGRSTPTRGLGEVDQAGAEPATSEIQVFVSFDVEHDGELYELLLEQSRTPGYGFVVSGGSTRNSDPWTLGETLRSRIREADQMIVICGEHTEGSVRVSGELRIAQEERTPYFLLWGRREIMCTKPVGAKPAEGMYSWTRQILQDQIAFTRRNERGDVAAESRRDATRKG